MFAEIHTMDVHTLLAKHKYPRRWAKRIQSSPEMKAKIKELELARLEYYMSHHQNGIPTSIKPTEINNKYSAELCDMAFEYANEIFREDFEKLIEKQQ